MKEKFPHSITSTLARFVRRIKWLGMQKIIEAKWKEKSFYEAKIKVRYAHNPI